MWQTKVCPEKSFEKTLLPRIVELVKPGGEYAGYILIIQGNNAGPHLDGGFVSFYKNDRTHNCWHWQPQAQQMPCMNNLDLAVFSSMNRHHIVLLQWSTTNTVQPDKIREAVLGTVWQDLDSCTIAWSCSWNSVPRSRFMYYCPWFFPCTFFSPLKSSTSHKGSNTFLHQESFYPGVIRDVYDRDKGIHCKYIVVDAY
jgi:hypothetical protein